MIITTAAAGLFQLCLCRVGCPCPYPGEESVCCLLERKEGWCSKPHSIPGVPVLVTTKKFFGIRARDGRKGWVFTQLSLIEMIPVFIRPRSLGPGRSVSICLPQWIAACVYTTPHNISSFAFILSVEKMISPGTEEQANEYWENELVLRTTAKWLIAGKFCFLSGVLRYCRKAYNVHPPE